MIIIIDRSRSDYWDSKHGNKSKTLSILNVGVERMKVRSYILIDLHIQKRQFKYAISD